MEEIFNNPEYQIYLIIAAIPATFIGIIILRVLMFMILPKSFLKWLFAGKQNKRRKEPKKKKNPYDDW